MSPKDRAYGTGSRVGRHRSFPSCRCSNRGTRTPLPGHTTRDDWRQGNRGMSCLGVAAPGGRRPDAASRRHTSSNHRCAGVPRKGLRQIERCGHCGHGGVRTPVVTYPTPLSHLSPSRHDRLWEVRRKNSRPVALTGTSPQPVLKSVHPSGPPSKWERPVNGQKLRSKGKGYLEGPGETGPRGPDCGRGVRSDLDLRRVVPGVSDRVLRVYGPNSLPPGDLLYGKGVREGVCDRRPTPGSSTLSLVSSSPPFPVGTHSSPGPQ